MIDASLFGVFCLVGPALHRVLHQGPLAQLLYVASCAGCVFLFAGLLAWLGGAWTYVIDPSGLGLLIVLFAVGGWGLSRDIALEAHADAKSLEAERHELTAQRLAIETQRLANEAQIQALAAERHALLALRAQLDPHFLFNTLNAIAEWCRDDPQVAERATLSLAGMLRAMLDGVRKPAWPLRTELALLTQLTELYAMRDEARYRFVLEIPSPVPDVEIPPMLLLPLIENAVTHGPSAGHDGEVMVRVSMRGEGLEVTLDNPGAYTGRREGGQGLSMVEKRLLLAYAGKASLTLRAEGGRTHTALFLPSGMLSSVPA